MHNDDEASGRRQTRNEGEDEMTRVSRRNVLRGGSMSLAAPLLAAGSSNQAEATTMTPGFIHVFAFQWKPGITPEQIEKARKEIAAFQGVVPGLIATYVGANHSAKNKGYIFGGVMEFADRALFEAYITHPAHKALLSWLVPLIDAIELDIQV